MANKILLSCGLIAALLYLGTDLLAGRLIKGYSFSAQSMSELGAAGSPTRPLVVTLSLLATIFMLAFSIGVWRAAGAAILPRIVAGLIIGNAVAGLIATIFFPNTYGVRPEFSTLPVLVMFVSVLCFFLAIIVGAVAFHGWMRIISIAIPVSYVLLAAFRFVTAASSAAGTNGLVGVQERTMSYSFLAWIACLAIYLLLTVNSVAESATGIY